MNDTLATSIPRASARRCAGQHFGPWSVEPKWFKAAVDAVRAGTLKPLAFDDWDDEEGDDDSPGYTIQNGVAVICIDGQMTKRGSSFGGCSTVAVRSALRRAAADWQVRSVLLHICSPGGTVAGTADLADDVVALRAGKLAGVGRAIPVDAFIADMGCSAAYWVASQCRTITANKTAVVGSIGTYTVLEDDTGLQEQIGIKYRVVSTGAYKGLGADGKVGEELVADVQREVNELNQPFLAAVSAGRGSKIADIAAVSDGRAYVSEQAQALGLIDGIASLDAAVAAAASDATLIRSKPMTATDQVKQIAADHPESVASFIQQGKNAGVADGRAEILGALKANVEAAKGDYELAARATIAGQDAEAIKLAVEAREKAAEKATADAKAHAAALAEKDKEIERLKFEAGGRPAINTGAATAAAAKEGEKGEAPAKPDTTDPKALKEWADAAAAHEWDANAESRKGYSTKDRFVVIRSRELLGQHKTLTK